MNEPKHKTLPIIYWAPRVSQEGIRRLYEDNARGFYSEELINEVGYALFARCKSIVAATKAESGYVVCPACGDEVPKGTEDRLKCTCGWKGSFEKYKKGYRGKKLNAGDTLPVFESYLQEFATATDLKNKVIAIDRLIHTFHHQLRVYPTAPAAKNLIEGNVKQVVAFLDQLTYGQHTVPELRDTRVLYEKTLRRSWVGGAPMPKKWKEPYSEN
jgi:hypothetical protein